VDPCCTPELERGFDERVAARDLAAYRRDGLPADQRRLLAGLVADDLGGKTVLDIGGGIGAIHHELLRAGARSVTDVDGSTAYLNAAQQEARRQGDVDQIDYRHGDFVQLADAVEPADIVILLRVLCCYPDMPALVHASAQRARRSYGVIYPRSTWWMRAAAAAFAAVRPVEGSTSGPGYVHGESDVDTAVRKEGFTPLLSDATWFWRVALYRRVAA
jgi:2-polyprenyl-3-methyl-5-hydroxy-6-metoxy-1,4-benzoquinol methylase